MSNHFYYVDSHLKVEREKFQHTAQSKYFTVSLPKGLKIFNLLSQMEKFLKTFIPKNNVMPAKKKIFKYFQLSSLSH